MLRLIVRHRVTLVSSALVLLSFSGLNAQNPEPTISFNRDIRPILSDKCFHCHGPDEESRETDLRFDDRDSVYEDLGGYAAVVPGDLEASELVRRIVSTEDGEIMPPLETKKPLTPAEIQLLKRWVAEGAEWAEFWAYAAPKKHVTPYVEKPNWANNWIDPFVLARIERNQLTHSPQADRVTLLRRASFDLTGLPPTPQQVDEFLNDKSPTAFEKVVDRLIASPQFGERIAVYWLDLVRFADTVGYHGDQDHNISPYRDWVIDAFNSNMPFDQFTREQLAGDLLASPSRQQKIASGYNRLLQTTHEGGLQPKEYSAIYAADRVRNVSAVWMGATVGCAQCHDHKYDPYTTKDFYSLSAFFADIDDERHFKVGTNALPTKRPPEILVIAPDSEAILKELAPKISQLKGKVGKAKKRLTSLEKQKKHPSDSTTNIDQELESIRAEHKRLVSELKRFEAQYSKTESRGAWTMVTESLKVPRETRVLPRGNWMDDSGPIVVPAIPEFLGQIDVGDRRANRLDLAKWLTDANQNSGKLTARVMANRIWYLLMGVGVSASLDDFGGQGQAPAAPELLDNLAMHFIQSNWNIKDLVRLIATSKTYQQTSLTSESLRQIDPYNQLFARQSRFRLSAEMIRDNALSIAGLLDTSYVGGKSVKPYQPGGYYKHLNFPKRSYAHHADKRQWRRGIYVHWQRQFLHPTMKSFDAPTREECTAARPKSNTPLAALALLNDPSFVEAARVFAERIIQFSEDDLDQQLEFAFRLAVSRKPDSHEKSVFADLHKMARKEFQQSPDKIKKLLSIGQSKRAPELDATKLAVWTSLARVILNMDETIARN